MEQLASAWVFVSHSSVDFHIVRQVRNYLEDRGAGPLLFHLRSLTRPEQFWPVIENEIKARNFFLYCDSPAAQQSTWVARERAAAEEARNDIIIGRLDVAAWPGNTSEVDDFLARVTCYLSYLAHDRARVAPFAERLARDQFGVWAPDELAAGDSFDTVLQRGIASAHTTVGFLTNQTAESHWVRHELALAAADAKPIVYVVLEPLRASPDQLQLPPAAAVVDAADGEADRAYRELRAHLISGA